MPELPEVQTTVSGLDKHVRGFAITSVWTDYNSPHFHGSDTIKDPSYFAQFAKKVTGKKIVSASRRAKNILIHLSGNLTILIHMKMTGHVLYGKYQFSKTAKKDPWTAIEEGPLKDPFNRFIHFVLILSNGRHICLSDMRKFAKVTLLESDSLYLSDHLKDIGPEPLENSFLFETFLKRISLRPNGKIKPVIMDQTIMAGVGNIYADESLWRAGIHPESQVKATPETTLRDLYKAIRATLLKGIDFGGDSMSDYRNIHGERGKFQEKHNAYRKTKSPCSKPGCRGTIVRKVIAARSGHFCDTHQKIFR